MTDPAAYLTTVDLDRLADNLADQYGGRWDAYRARCWLTQGASPFQVTDDYRAFYGVEDPAAWLHPDEILTVRPTELRAVKYRKLGQTEGAATRSPYKRRHKVA